MYLTPAAIGYLTELILAGVITLYLATRLRHASSPTQMRLLVAFLGTTTLFIFLLFCDVALVPSQRLPAVFLQNSVVALCLLLLLQFAYSFPSFDPRKKWEARLVLAGSILYMLWEMQFAFYRFNELSAGRVQYRSGEMDNVLVAGFLWVPFAFIRQAISSDERTTLWIHKLLRPQGRGAQAARMMALVFLFTLALAVVNLSRTNFYISTVLYQVGMSLGLACALFAFAIAYLNALPESTSFMVKLAGTTLTALLIVLSSVGWVMTPAYAAEYRLPIADYQTLRFTPNAMGGYDVTHVPFRFDDDLGQELNISTSEGVDQAALYFAFPFFGTTGQRIFVTDAGTVSIDQPLDDRSVQYHYGNSPAIFLMNSHLAPEAGGSIFAKNDGEHLTVTWSKVAFFFNRQSTVTFQLVLERNGSFEITYNGLPEKLTFDPDQNPFENVWLIGAVSGDLAHPPRQVSFAHLPLRGESGGLVQDIYLDFRHHVHRLLAPLAYLILVSSLLIVVGVPMLLYFMIVAPLNVLLAGVRQVNAGNRTIKMPIQSRDEIGFLTESFNDMIAQLSVLVTGLEGLVAKRTAELHYLAITDFLTGIFNRRHLLILGAKALEQAQRYHRPLAAIMVDIDHFKQINDQYGHTVGDLFLKELAQYLQKNLRAADILGRYGGEEFVILMPETDLETAQQSAERLLVGIRGLHIPTDTGQVGLTTSIGIVAFDSTRDTSIDALIQRADQAMYAAKQAGRNRVVAPTLLIRSDSSPLDAS